METTRDYDEITSFLGEYGLFQIIVLVVLSVSGIPNGYTAMCMVFLADIPEHHCKQSSNNSSGQIDPDLGIPFLDGSRPVSPGVCSRYKWVNVSGGATSGLGNDTEGCLDGWVFSTEMYTATIVSEWELVCGNAWKVPLSTAIFFFGVLIGSLISGQLSDRFGRKPVFFFSMGMQTVVSLVQATSVSWAMFCILGCLRGMSQISNYFSSLVLGSEILSGRARASFTLVGHSMCFGLGHACLALSAYFMRGWRMLLVVAALPGFLFIPLWWVIPESPRWLLLQGRVEEAEHIIRTAARMNRASAPEVIFGADDCLKLVQRNGPEGQQRYTFLDLFRTRNIRNTSIINILLWVVISMVFYGLSLNTANMDGDAYLNCFVSAAIEMVACAATWLLIGRAPRPTVLFSTLLFCGVTLLTIRFIPEDQPVLAQALAQLGKLGVSGSFCFVCLFSTELFPTAIRNMGLGSASTAARIGTILAPYVLYLGVYSRILPYLIFGVISLLSAFLSLLLPDTRGCTLPDNIDQVQPIRCCCLRWRSWPWSKPAHLQDGGRDAECRPTQHTN